MKKLNNINQSKFARQEIGVNRWFNSSNYGSHKDRNGCLNYFTGVGKTFTAMLIIDRYLKSKSKASIIIIAPAHLVPQWKEVINNTFYAKEVETVYIYSPEYLINRGTILHPHLLIVDELDAFYSTQRKKLINKQQIKYQDLLALTATYEDINKIYLEIQTFCPIIDKIGEQEALTKGYVSKYIEYNLGLEFNSEEQQAHKEFSEDIRKGLSKFGKGSLNLAMKCISGGKDSKGIERKSTDYCYQWAKYNGWREGLNLNNPADRELHDLWNPHMIFIYAINLMKAIKKRKELIYTASAKLDATIKILENFKFTSGIVFSQSIVFADLVYNIINELQPDNAVIYHSKVKTQMLPSPKTGKLIKFGAVRLKRRAMERINNRQSNHLITSSALDKGLDIPILKFGVTTSGTQNPTQNTQRKGRATRVDKQSKEGVVLLINLYIKNSKEVTWLKNRQSKNSNIIYWINSVNEISYKPEIKKDKITLDNI